MLITQKNKQRTQDCLISSLVQGVLKLLHFKLMQQKKKLEEQRYELKVFLNMTYGPKAYDELLAMEGQIRKDRQKQGVCTTKT